MDLKIGDPVEIVAPGHRFNAPGTIIGWHVARNKIEENYIAAIVELLMPARLDNTNGLYVSRIVVTLDQLELII